MGDAVPQFASFMDGSWCSGVQWLPMPPGNENSSKERAHPVNVLALVGVNLGICTLKVDGAKHPWCAVARAS